jgi:mono/diheme cytochrome c family protein
MKLLLSIILLPIVLAACSDDMHSAPTQSVVDRTYSSDGERIYFTGQSESGRLIKGVGGHHHMQIHGGSCVTCHGVKREGGVRMFPWFWVMAPPLTTAALVEDHEDEEHAHDTYAANSLKKAITDGINPAGKQLDNLMPRWTMADKDLESLVHFLLSESESTY